MGAKKKPLETKSAGDVGDRGRPRRLRQRPRPLQRLRGPAGQVRGPDHRGRGHQRDGREDRRVAGREEAAGMSGILVYALHYDGAFNKNSLGAVSEGARLAAELGTECHAIVVGEGVADDLGVPARQLRRDRRSTASRAPRASRSRSSTRWRRRSRPAATATRCSAAACSASRSAPAWPRAWTPASAWRSRASASRTASSSPSARSCRTRRSRRVHYRSGVGVIIGRLNAFETQGDRRHAPRSRTSTSSSRRTR